MRSELERFPLWKNDGKATIRLNSLQEGKIIAFKKKVESGKYRLINNPCLCGNRDKLNDVLVTQKDRYGIPCDNVLCKKCGLIRLDKRLDDDSTAEFYKNEYRDIYVGQERASDEFFTSQAERGKAFYRLMEKHVNFNEVNKVFEVGCGAGGILFPFREDGKNVSGCDFGEKYLQYGKDKGLDLYQGEINRLKTPDNSQDLVILSHVMEHFNEPVKSLNRIIEIIAPDKYLFVEVPGLFDIHKTYLNPILYFQNAHVYNYYSFYLENLFESLGLDVIFGNEKCSFLLKKPRGWSSKNNISIDEKIFTEWSVEIEKYIEKVYRAHRIKINPYYYKRVVVNVLNIFGIKSLVKNLLGGS